MAIFIRTDMPVPPGTASLSSQTGFTGTSYAAATLYHTSYTVGGLSEVTLASLSITLSKRSLVVITVSSFMTLTANNTFRHRIYINTVRVYESAYDPDSTGQLRTHATYVVLEPGTYTISYRLYNSYTATYYVYIQACNSARPALKLLVVVIPLEP